MPTRDIKYNKHPHIKTLKFKKLQAEIWHFWCERSELQTYFTQIPVWLSTFVSGTLCLAFMWISNTADHCNLGSTLLSLLRHFANFTTHKSDFTVRVGNLLCLVSIICAKNRFELLSTPNWSYTLIFNRRRVTNNMQIRSEIVSVEV